MGATDMNWSDRGDAPAETIAVAGAVTADRDVDDEASLGALLELSSRQDLEERAERRAAQQRHPSARFARRRPLLRLVE
ncbi:hypothetical protein [Rhodococcus kronopolitis]|uniref:Uncharacterized protein n=1 Tax=Rhodococcus kronopolitis TaxID=1460226 RepID=A0ABV9FW68_9NOCA